MSLHRQRNVNQFKMRRRCGRRSPASCLIHWRNFVVLGPSCREGCEPIRLRWLGSCKPPSDHQTLRQQMPAFFQQRLSDTVYLQGRCHCSRWNHHQTWRTDITIPALDGNITFQFTTTTLMRNMTKAKALVGFKASSSVLFSPLR